MEQFIAMILAILMALPAFHSDKETNEEREVRMTTIATAIGHSCYAATCSGKYDTKECEPIFKGSINECGAALVTIGFWESRFAKHIHEGKCRKGGFVKTSYGKKWVKGECDETVIFDVHGNLIRQYFKSKTVYQMQWDKGINAWWRVMDGTSQNQTNNATWAAMNKWSRCWPNKPQKAFMCYAGTKSTAWSGGPKRAHFYEARMRHIAADSVDKSIEKIEKTEKVASNE